MLKHKLVDFIIQFMEEVDKEISEMKLFVCSVYPVYVHPMRAHRPTILTSLTPLAIQAKALLIPKS